MPVQHEYKVLLELSVLLATRASGRVKVSVRVSLVRYNARRRAVETETQTLLPRGGHEQSGCLPPSSGITEAIESVTWYDLSRLRLESALGLRLSYCKLSFPLLSTRIGIGALFLLTYVGLVSLHISIIEGGTLYYFQDSLKLCSFQNPDSSG